MKHLYSFLLLLSVLLALAPSRASAQFSRLPLPWHAMGCETIGPDTVIASLIGSVPVEHCAWCTTNLPHVMLVIMVGHVITDTVSYHGDFYASPLVAEQVFEYSGLIPYRQDRVAWHMSGSWPPMSKVGGLEFYSLHPFARTGCSSDSDQVYQYPNYGEELEMGLLCEDCTLKASIDIDTLPRRTFISKRVGKGILWLNSGYTVAHCSGTTTPLTLPSATCGPPRFCDDSTIIATDRGVITWTTDEGASWKMSPSLELTTSDTILAAHRYLDGTLEAVIVGESTTSTIAVLQQGQAVWQRYIVPSNAHNPYSKRYFWPVSIVGSTISSGITSIDFSMYVWDPLMSIPRPTDLPTATENFIVQRGQPIRVDNANGEVMLTDVCGRSIGPLPSFNETVSTDSIEPGTYLMMVGTRYRGTVLIIP